MQCRRVPSSRVLTAATLREKRTEKVQNMSGQQFAQTFSTQGGTEVLCLFSVLFCTVPYGHHRDRVQRLCTLAALIFLCIFFVLKHGIFSSVRHTPCGGGAFPTGSRPRLVGWARLDGRVRPGKVSCTVAPPTCALIIPVVRSLHDIAAQRVRHIHDGRERGGGRTLAFEMRGRRRNHGSKGRVRVI